MQTGEPNTIRFQELHFQIEDVHEPCSAVVSNAKPLRRPRHVELAPSCGCAKSSKPSVESSVVHLIKSTHEINQNRIRKGKTIMNKHSKPGITRQSSLTVNLNRGSSRQIKNVPGAVKEVQSPLSSCRSSPVKLQSKQADPNQQPILVHRAPVFNQPAFGIVDYETRVPIPAFPNIGAGAFTEPSATQPGSKQSSLSVNRASAHQSQVPIQFYIQESKSANQQLATLADGSRSQNQFVLSSRQLLPAKDEGQMSGVGSVTKEKNQKQRQKTK